MDLNRKTAYEVLLDMETNQSYSNLALNNFIEKNKPENPAFVRELVYGVLENRILLDYYLAQLVASGLKKVKKQDLTILRMGVYQILAMDSVPDYAAINESVVLARKFCRGRDKFINGVLRNFQRRQAELEASLPDRSFDPAKYLDPHSEPSFVVSVVMLAVFCSIVSGFFVNYAAARMPVVNLATIGTLMTITAAFAGVIFLQEPVSSMSLAGTVLILYGIRQVTKPE